MDGTDPIIDLFLASYRREFDYYQEAARLCGQLCEHELRGAGKRVIVTHRAKNPERLADKLHRRKQEEKKEYKTAQDIQNDIIDLPGCAARRPLRRWDRGIRPAVQTDPRVLREVHTPNRRWAVRESGGPADSRIPLDKPGTWETSPSTCSAGRKECRG